ncbi:MAG: bifunctional hydroxymethylpyrimidine kinase/phosphomethylpyrimidine kinase [Planctomycetota bacterium]
MSGNGESAGSRPESADGVARHGGRPLVLVCAGHDPSGGAGVDADREAIEACGARVRAVVTTDTDQDGVRVRGFVPRAADRWRAEAEVHMERQPHPRALKFGLLSDRAAVEAAAALARRAARTGIPVVVDPVLAASGGERFLDGAGVRALLGALIPSGVVLTPNLHEAAELTGRPRDALVADSAARGRAAGELLALGAAAVVLKDGHGTAALVRDWVCTAGEEPLVLERPRQPGPGIHGSGCRHASALAAGLARGLGLGAAASAAGDYLAARISKG